MENEPRLYYATVVARVCVHARNTADAAHKIVYEVNCLDKNGVVQLAGKVDVHHVLVHKERRPR